MRICNRFMVAGFLLALSSAAVAGSQSGPVKIPADQANGTIFKSPSAKVDGKFTNFEMGKSSDQKFITGMFKSEAGEEEFSSYPDDEFCYFVSGSSTLISADGSSVTYKAGDGAFIPKGWKGRWVSPSGFSKFYAIYVGADAPAP